MDRTRRRLLLLPLWADGNWLVVFFKLLLLVLIFVFSSFLFIYFFFLVDPDPLGLYFYPDLGERPYTNVNV